MINSEKLVSALRRFIGDEYELRERSCTREQQLSFAVLPTWKAPRWLLPLAERHSMLGALHLYAPYSWTARIGTTFLTACIKSGWTGWARHRLYITTHREMPLSA